MKRPYPTRNGLIISPYELGCTVPTRERTNIHHGYWPWNKLGDHFISRTFGSLITNTFEMIPEEHNIGRFSLHHDYSPPKLPNFTTMVEVVDEYLDIQGQIDCIKHNSTREQFIVNREQWLRGAHNVQEMDPTRNRRFNLGTA